MRKKTIRGIAVILVIASLGTVLSGFSVKKMTEEEIILYELLKERTAVMQKAIFRVYDSEDGVADIEEVYDVFHRLADIETYPLLSEDCKVISESAGTDFDKVVNLDILEIRFLSKTGKAAFYETEVKWYMSGNTGMYNMICRYKIMTVEDEYDIKLADIELIS